jgi:hypothetical protein
MLLLKEFLCGKIRLCMGLAANEKGGDQQVREGVRRAVDLVPLLVEERLFRTALTLRLV